MEKRKRVIRLERRGRRKMSVAAGIFGMLGALCFLYCLSIGLFVNFGSKFFLVWGVLGVFFGFLSLLFYRREWLDKIPLPLKLGAVILFAAGSLLFVFVETLILSEFHSKASAGADYVVVLGAQWKENGPSYVLQKRLEKALGYLEENPETKVIVTGGQGANEPVSEGEGMQAWFLDAGIDPDRILTEKESVNTYENIIFSGELFDKTEEQVVLVTSNFHVFRAVQIAQKQGYAHAEGLAADSYAPMLPNNMLREFFGVVKDFVIGNL